MINYSVLNYEKSWKLTFCRDGEKYEKLFYGKKKSHKK